MSGDTEPTLAHPVQENHASNGALPTEGGVEGSEPPRERRPIITNPEALSDPEYSDEDAPPVEEIAADEGKLSV